MDKWNKRPDFVVGVDDFEELLELSECMTSKTRNRVNDLVRDFDGTYEDFIGYVSQEYEKCYVEKWGEKPWNPYIDLYWVGQWIFEDENKFREMCQHFQDNGWLYNWV